VRKFLFGVLAGLLLVVLAVGGLLLSLSRDQQRPATPSPTVAVPGAPGRLAPGETWLSDVDLSSSAVLTSSGPLTGVRARGQAVRLTRGELVAGRLTIDAVLPYATAATQVGPDTELYAAGPGRAGMHRNLSVLGREVRVTATGAVTAEGGLLVVEPQTLDVGGASWLTPALSRVVRELVTIRQPVEGVPEGMRLTAVSPTAEGFEVHLEGSGIQLTS
jgi:LmeA-like phospholipid-binding